MKDINEIKPLMSLDFPWLPFLATLLIMLGIIVFAGWLIMRLLRKKVTVEPEEEIIKPILPQSVRDEALLALERLSQSAALKQGQAQYFYLEIEAILKRFLEGLHQQPVNGFTDQELEAFLKALPHFQWQESGFEAFLQRSLLARFARNNTPKELMQEDLRLLKLFVQQHTAD
jgi:hypothetical protein